jgi:hypothetical protein
MLCKSKNCLNLAKTRNLCQKHYDLLRYGKLVLDKNNLIITMPLKKCTVIDCENIATKYTYCSKHAFRWVKYKSLDVPLTKGKHNYFSDITNSNVCYFAGLLYGDGNVLYSKVNNSYYISLEMTDMELVKALFFETQIQNKLIYAKRTNCKPTLTFRFASKQMFDDLSFFNVVPNKTYCDYFKLPNLIEENIWAYLRGILDSDGSVCNGSIQLLGTNLAFAKEISSFLTKHSIKTSIYQPKLKENCTRQLYTIMIYGKENISIFYNKIYANAKYFLKRKKDKMQNFLSSKRR